MKEQSLLEVWNICEDIRNCSSSKAKQHILSKNKDNITLQKILYYTYNDMQYGVKKTSIDKMMFVPDGTYKWNNIWEMFEDLAKANINKDLILKISNTIGYFPDEEIQKLLIQVLLKDLKMGMNVKSINKVIPNLIYEHSVQLASKFEGVLKKEVSMSLKEDGIRCSILMDKGQIKFVSRQGKGLGHFGEIEKSLLNMNLDNCMLDGELIRINKDKIPSSENFRKTTQIVNSKANNKVGLQFVVFDLIPIQDYYRQKNEQTYEQRLNIMETLIEENEFIQLVPKFGITKDVDYIMKVLDIVVKNGEEGLILNVMNAPYEFKRTKNLLKVKQFADADVLVVGMEEGEGRLEGVLGKIECQFKYENEIHTVYVGSGFSDEEREYYWNNKEELLNKVVTIKYFEISTSKQGGTSLRFPTWEGIVRMDKSGIDDTNV